jgi:hypothetical protein
MRLGRTRALGLVLGLWAGLPGVGVHAQDARPVGPMEALVAVVGGDTPGPTTDPILLSDVELVARLALARSGNGSGPLTPALLQAALEQLVGEILIRREASRLHAADPPPDAARRQREAIERAVGGPEALAALLSRHGVGPEEIDAIATRRAVVESFLGANLEGSTAITDADVERAYLEQRHPFVGRPLDEVREGLRAWLRVTRLDADVARWLATLRRRSAVRVLRPFVQTDGERTDEDGRTR